MLMHMRFALLTVGRILPFCLLVLAPKVAIAEALPKPQDKAMIETAETVMALITVEAETRADGQAEAQPSNEPNEPTLDEQDEQPVFRYERIPSRLPAESVPSNQPDDLMGVPLDESLNSVPDSAPGPMSGNEFEPESLAEDLDTVEATAEGSGIEPLDNTADDERLDEHVLGEIASDEDGSDEDGSDEDGSDEYLRWQQLLMEGDRLFLQGRYLDAEARYQEAKDPEDDDPDPIERPEAFTDPALLSTAGQVYWREYQAGLEAGMDTRIQVPLELLTQEFPEFIPAQIDYALLLSESEDDEAKQEAIELLEQGTALFPDHAALARTRVDFLAAEEEWLQAAIAARQFAVLNPEAPEREEFEAAADEYQRKFRSRLRGQLTRNAIGNAIMGGVGFALTGNLFGPFSALETTVMMLRGESAIGESIANRAAEELDLIEHEEVVSYVNDIGQELASLAGRDEFEYEFYVVEEDDLNAFALPGGKVFVNAGAILSTETEAELAGLVAHELAHAVLSHGFQMMTSGNLTANVLQLLPYGGYVANLAVLRYSRGMERQADRLGTQLLANSHYAADGLHRLMITLHEEGDRQGRFDWLSTHPDTPERIRNLDRLIDENGYNRYAFEGIERHLQVRERVEQLLREADKLDDDDTITIQDSPDGGNTDGVNREEDTSGVFNE